MGDDNMKRFVKEYAVWKISNLKLNPDIQPEIVAEKVEKIKKALSAIERELITTEEAMKLIVGV